MRGFSCLDNNTYEKLRKLNRTKVISDTIYHEIEDCHTFKQIKQIIAKYFQINSKKEIDCLWCYIIKNSRWSRGRNISYLNEYQFRFIHLLIEEQGGICTEKHILDYDFFQHQIDRHIFALEELELILSITTRRIDGSHTLFVVHPKVLQNVKR
jgi:hypothetical protein